MLPKKKKKKKEIREEYQVRKKKKCLERIHCRSKLIVKQLYYIPGLRSHPISLGAKKFKERHFLPLCLRPSASDHR